MFNIIQTWYGKFEDWVNSWMPGFKTTIVTGLGAVGSAAAVCQQYITQLPLDKFATATQIAIGSLIVSLLALWFHAMGDRVDARAAA